MTLSLMLVCVGVIIYQGASERAVEGLSDQFVGPVLPADDKGAETSSGEPDWDGLAAETGNPASLWVRVDNTGVDFPVAQWADNDYGLHHDIYGNWSWAGVFADADCDPAADANVVVYGHTLYGGGMFSDLSRTARDQGSFNSVGDLHYAVPGQGWTTLHPTFALDVTPDFVDVQRFSFEPNEVDVRENLKQILAKHEARHDVNVCVGTGKDTSAVRYVSSVDEIDTACAVQLSAKEWYVATDEEVAQARKQAEETVFRAWLQDMAGHATCVASDADAKIATAKRSVVLACCSWPFNNHRTLLFFTA